MEYYTTFKKNKLAVYTKMGDYHKHNDKHKKYDAIYIRLQNW